MKLLSKKILISLLICVTLVCSIVAICLAVCIPDQIIENNVDAPSTQSIDCETDDVQFLTDQDKYVQFGVKSDNSITSANMKDYVTVTDVSGNLVSVSYSNGNVCAPSKGYNEGGAYTISLKNGAKFVDSRFREKQELVFLIHKDEIFNAVVSENTNELSNDEYISFNGTDRLVLTTNKYKQGDIVKFERSDYYNQPAAVKVVSSHQVYGGTEYVVEQPYMEEVFDELEVSENYDVHEEDFEINEEGIKELLGELENVPAMSDNGFLNFLPEIKLEVEPCNGGINVGLTIRYNIANIWKCKDGIGKAIADKIINQSNGALTGSLNVYLIFKLQFINEFNVYQDLDLATGNFSTVATKTTTTKIGFYLEVEGGILGASDDNIPKTKGKDEYGDLNKLFDEFKEKYDLRKEIKIASLHATYMGLVGVGLDVNLVFGFSFNGQIGIENTMTTVQQEGMIVTTDGEKPVENKKTSYSNWGLSAYGVARAEFGIKVDIYIDFLVVFKAGVSIEAGIYAEIGGAFAVEWGDGYVPTTKGDEVSSYEQSVYTAMYFETGVYIRASFFAEVNLFITKFEFRYTFLDIEIKLIEVGNKECVSFILPEDDKTLVMENNKVDFPQIYVQRYNLFEGKKSIEPVNFDDIEMVYDTNALKSSENGGFVDVSGQTEAEYKVGIGLYDYKFVNNGTGVELEWFSKSVITRQKEAYIADSIELTIIKEPKDIASFELSVVGDVNTIEIGTSLVLTPINILPYNATFSAIECSLKNPIDGVEISDNVLSVSLDAVPDQKIVISACTVKNKKVQVYSNEIEITIKDAVLSDISIYPYNAFDMSEFKGGTIIPLGSDIKLNVIKYPENAKYTNLYYEIIDGEQYLKNAYTADVITSDGELSVLDDLSGNCKIAIVAHAINTNGEEIISRTLTLNVQVRAIKEVEIVTKSDIVHQGETIRLSVSLKPYTAEADEVQYAIISGQSLAKIDKDTGILTVNNSADIGGKISVIAIADGVESKPYVFTITEIFAENLTLVDSNGTLETELHYGETVKLNVRIYPNDVTYKNYEYEILSGRENIYLDSINDLISLKYNFDPTNQIRLRVKKVLNDGKDTTIYSNVYTINVLTESLTDFYLLPNIDNILPGEEYKFEYSFKEDVIDKNSTDYITDCKYELIEGADYAYIDDLGNLRIDEEVAQQNYCVVLRCTLTTYNGIYTKEVKLNCKMVAKEIIVSSESLQIMTSESMKLNVAIQPLSAYIKTVEYQFVQGDTYGSIDDDGVLTVYDAQNVGKTISVRAVVTSIGIDPVSGKEIETVGYSMPYMMTIIEKPVESVEFIDTILTLQQNESYMFVANVTPTTATYKNVSYSLIDPNNCANISFDGTVTVKQNAKVGSVVTVVATSQADSSITAQYEFTVTKATLNSFDIYIQDSTELLIAPSSEVRLMTKNPSPSYYQFDDGEVVYSVVSGDATIIGDRLTVGKNAKADTIIKVKAVANDIVSYFEFGITVLSWTTAPKQVERGSDIIILAEYEGENKGYTIEYYFAATDALTSIYGEIINNNSVHIYDRVTGGTEIELIARLGNIEIKYTCTVKKITSIVLDTIKDSKNNLITSIIEDGINTTSMLHPNYRLNSSPDTIQLSVKAYLSDKSEADVSSYSVNYSKGENPTYLNVVSNTGVVSLTSNSYSGRYATVNVEIEGKTVTILRIYVFVPAGTDSDYGKDEYLELTNLTDGASMLTVPQDVSNDEYTTFKKGDSYNIGRYLIPRNYTNNEAIRPTNLTYITSSGSIDNMGYWQASANAVGGSSFIVTLSSSGSYKGRVYHSDISKDVSFTMPIYIYNQSGLSSLNNKDGEYYLRNDITLSGYWTPIETFSGTFDGGWHTISNMQINVSDDGVFGDIYVGLFKQNNGTIRDVSMKDFNISYVLTYYKNIQWGTLAAINKGTISRCYTSGSLYTESNAMASLGGIVYSNSGTLSKCVNSANLTGESANGLYILNTGDVKECQNTGSIVSLS